ncbi:MAG: hypothetical protein Ta2G_20580 [Termitinemataceae bacterium]|nr:MAG: hypothetical protein Ta2G_20580 [Termitinemataceae bacterium]
MIIMNTASLVFVILKLVFGAFLAFLAIMVWAKTRDPAWILMVLGTIFAYIEIVYSILAIFGITKELNLLVGNVPAFDIILYCVSAAFYILAFTVMLVRR